MSEEYIVALAVDRRGHQWPAVWFHRWLDLRFRGGGAVMPASRGAADTFPLRVNCPSEVILCEEA